jgi:hypothetical protein
LIGTAGRGDVPTRLIHTYWRHPQIMAGPSLRRSASPRVVAMNGWRYRDLLEDGMSRGQIYRGADDGLLRRVAKGLYLDGCRPATLASRLRALLLLLPPEAAIGFHTGAALYGFDVLDDARAHVVVPATAPVPDIAGVAAHSAVLPFEPMLVDGIPCLPADRCAIDVARTCPGISTLGVLDAALRSQHCTPTSLAAELEHHDGLRGVRRVRRLLPFADPRPECLQESQVRSIIITARLPVPQPQVWVMDDWGDPIYRLDLGWAEHKVGAEYDGESHLGRPALRSDRSRHNWLVARDWRMRYFTDWDLYRRPGYIASTLRTLVIP